MTKIKRTKNGCLSCRYAKKKCDELKPTCTLCVKKKVACVWSSNKKQSLAQFIKVSDGKPYFDDINMKKKNEGQNWLYSMQES